MEFYLMSETSVEKEVNNYITFFNEQWLTYALLNFVSYSKVISHKTL